MGLMLDEVLIIALCVVTAGLVMSAVCQFFDRPYLLTVTGSGLRLTLVGTACWSAAAAVGAAAWVILSWFLSGTMALAIFFAVEAAALDVCAQRIRYVRRRPRQAVTRPPLRPLGSRPAGLKG